MQSPEIMTRLIYTLLGCCCWLLVGTAQERPFQPNDAFFQIDERKIVETKWRYAYTLQLEANTVIHRAEDTYEYFLFFRYNGTFQEYLNGKFRTGRWTLDNAQLDYQFKHVNQFEIALLNRQKLVLEFTQSNSKGTFQYHFVRVATEDAPFIKPANELPDVNVEANQPRRKDRKWWVFNNSRRGKKRRKKQASSDEKEDYISIEVTGGGFYGGLNPTLRDYIHIKSDGRLIKEHKSRENGLSVIKKNIPRAELERFAEYVVSQDFFNLERIYDCETELCQKRKRQKPTPIPLRVAIAYKERRKVVTIGVFGADQHKIRYVDYPPALDNIVAAIQKMAIRLESKGGSLANGR